MLAESVIGIVRAVNGLLEKVNAQGQASIVKSGARLEEGDVLTLLSGEAYIQFIHGFPEALALEKPVKLDGVSPTLQYGVEDLKEQMVQEAIAKGIDPSIILDVLGSAAAGAEAVGSGGDAFIIDPLFGFGQVTAGYPTGPIAFGYEADTQHLFWYVPEETGAIAESELTTEPESIPQIPQFNSNQATVIVFEDALTGGIQDSAGQVTTARTSLSPLISSSSEVASSFAFNTNLSALPKLKSGGIELDYILSSDRLALSASMPDGTNVARFELTADGQLTQILIGAIDHPTADSDDSEWMRLDLSPVIDVTFTRTSDGTVLESRTLPDNAVVAGIQDDVPIARAQLTNNEILLDETIGMKVGDADAANDDFNPTTTADPFNNTYGRPIGLVQNANLLDTSTSEMGGDYKNATMTHLLKITDAVSGLQTTNGTPINLFLESNGDITGRAGDIGAPAVFAIRMNPNTGAISVAQYGPIKQFDTNSHDEAVDLTGRISAVVRVTDGDGDVSSAEIPIGQLIIFEDDGPSIDGSKVLPADVLAVDETNLGVNATASFADNFAQAIDFGEDGAGSVSYALVLNGNNVGSGLYAIDNLDVSTADGDGIGRGGEIVLNQNGNVITGSLNGTDYFTITIDAASGTVTFDQLASVWHANTANPDDQSALQALANSLVVRATVVDADGDQAAYDLDVSQGVFQVKDDGPSINGSKVLSADVLAVDETNLGVNATASFADNFAQAIDFGEDGAGSVSYALVLNGNNVGSGLYAIDNLDVSTADGDGIGRGGEIVLNQNGNVITGSLNGTDYFTITIDAASGTVTFDQLASVWHANTANPDDQSALQALANSLVVRATVVDADGDQAAYDLDVSQGVFQVKDDGPSIDGSKVLSADVLAVDETNLGVNATASFADNFAQAIDFGEDGAGSVSYALVLNGNNVGSGLYAIDNLDVSTADGDGIGRGGEIVLNQNGNVITGSLNGTDYFTITIDAASGTVTFDQLASVWHANTANPDDQSALQALANSLVVRATVVDADGDQAAYDLDVSQGVFQVKDDGPSIDGSKVLSADVLAVDETNLGVNATASFADNFAQAIDFGEDGAGSVSYALVLNGNNVGSGLYAIDNLDVSTADGDGIGRGGEIVLNQNGNVITGSLNGTDYFTITIDAASGTVTFDQLASVWHANTANPDDQSALQALANSLVVRATVVDADGDQAAYDLDVSQGVFQVKDDGPSIDGSKVLSADVLAVDETNLGVNATASFADNFAQAIDFGEDGAGSVSYALVLNGNNVGSGLYAIDNLDVSTADGDGIGRGGEIVLNQNGNVITGSLNGTDYFTITIDAASGTVTFDQLASVWHANTANPDDQSALQALANSLVVRATVMDADGDQAAYDLDVSQGVFQVKDDGPSIDGSKVLSADVLAVDETNLGVNATASFADNFAQAIDFGEDGAGSVSYALVLNGNNVGSGLYAIDNLDVSTADGDGIGRGGEIVLNQNGNVITGSLNGTDYFTITIDAASGAVTFDQLASVWHANTANPDDQSALQALANSLVVRATVMDADGDQAAYDLDVSQGVFQVKDDGPSIDGSKVLSADVLAVDETNLGVNATASFADNFAQAIDFGEDGAGSVSYALVLNGNNVGSGLYAIDNLDVSTADGDGIGRGGEIVLNQNGNVITGSLNGTDYFTITIDAASGAVMFDQLASVWHANTANPDDQSALQALANSLVVRATVVDADGDQAAYDLDVSQGVFQVKDDGPSIDGSKVLSADVLAVDETNLGVNATASFADNFAQAIDFGEDGAGSVSYALVLNGNNVGSGLYAIDNLDVSTADGDGIGRGGEIVLNQNGNVITGSLNGTDYFTITIDAASGTVTFDQLASVWHANTANPDDQSALQALANSLVVRATVVDADGDQAAYDLDVSQGVFQVKDDGPSINGSKVLSADVLAVDETNLGVNATASFADNFAQAIDFGEDGAGSVSYALVLNGNNVGSGLYAIDNLDVSTADGDGIGRGGEIVLNQNGNVITGSLNGTDYFTITIDAASGTVTFDQLASVWHANTANPDDQSALQALANSLVVRATVVDADGDQAAYDLDVSQGVFQVKDDGPSIDGSKVLSADVLAVDETNLGVNATASFADNFAQAIDFGEDGAGSVSYALVLNGNNVGSGLYAIDNLDVSTADGDGIGRGGEIVLNQNGNVITGSLNGTDYFTITIDAASGTVTFDQLASVWHANTANPDDQSALQALANSLVVRATVVDADGDQAAYDLDVSQGVFQVKDDGPSIDGSKVLSADVLAVDETNLGVNATASFADNFAQAIDFGEDGAGSVSYALVLNGNNVGSGLYAIDNLDVSTADGDGIGRGGEIVLNQNGNVITGSLNGTDYFTITIDAASGTVTFDQLASVWHANTANPDDQSALQALANSLVVRATVVDADGDQAAYDLDVSQGVFQVKDDGPSIDGSKVLSADVLAVDETNLGVNATASFADNFAQAIDFGEDGAGSVSYALVLNGNNVGSGLYAIDNLDVSTADGDGIGRGGEIVLNQNGNVITGSLNGTDYFTITIDAASGTVTFDQLASVWHANTANPDDQSALQALANSLVVRATVVDADGDQAAYDLDVSQGVFQVKDDGPSIDGSKVLSADVLAVDETNLGVNATASFADNFAQAIDFGEDGAGSVSYALVLNGNNVGSGLYAIDNLDVSTADGDGIGRGGEIVLNQNGNVITGSLNGTDYFTITIDAASGAVTFDQLASVWHANTANPDDQSALQALANSLVVRATVMDADGDQAAYDLDVSQGVFQVKDDGPSIDGSKVLSADVLAVDETNLGVNATASFADNFAQAIDFGEDGAGSVSYALVLNGNNVGSGLYAIDNLDVSTADGDGIGRGGEIVLNQNGNVITGSLNGTDYFTITIDAASGTVTFDQLASVWHANTANPDDQSALQALANSLVVRATVVDADGDQAAYDLDVSQGVFQVKDDGPSIDGSKVLSADVLAVDETNLGVNATASFADNFAQAIDFGEDGAGSVSYALVLNGNNVGSGLYAIDNLDVSTADGDGIGRGGEIVLNQNGNVITGSLNGTDYFTITIDAASGTVTFDQLASVWHANTANPDDQSALQALANSLVVRATVVDADGDQAAYDLDVSQGVFQVKDDGPSIDGSKVLSADVLAVDETNLGVNATASFADNFAQAIDFGEDGAGSVSYALVLNGNNVGSGLYAIDNLDVSTADGDGIGRGGEIVLNQNGNVITGSLNGTDYFTITIDAASGAVTFDQLASVWHANTANPDDQSALQALANSLVVRATVMDADGDQAAYDLDVSQGVFQVKDDGPSIDGSKVLSADVLAVDETNLGVNATASFADNFAQAIDFGEDGAGSVSYALVLNGNNVGSGLYAIDNLDVSTADGDGIGRGGEIVLNQNGNVITGSLNGTDYFTITIDAASGTVTFDQLASVWHANTANPDDQSALQALANSLVVRATVVDADGDQAAYDLDVSQGVFQVKDDGPSIDGSKVLSADVLAVDETNLGVNATASFADNFAQAIDFGEDGAGSVSYALVLNGNNVGSGLYAIDNLDVSTADGDGIGRGGEIVLNQNGNVITGSLNGTDYFTITIDAASGAVTFDQLASVWHANTANPDDQSALQALANSLVVRATVMDADGDQAAYDLDVSQGVFQVKDDGPSIDGSKVLSADVLAVDETNLGVNATASFADNFAQAIDFGEDGAGSVSYALVLNGNNVGSGLYAIDNLDVSTADGDGIGRGGEIVLNQNGNVITGSLNGTDYFTITIDAASGTVTFDQLASVWHANTANPDDQSALQALANSLVVRATVVDADGDQAAYDLDVSQGVFQVKDDGPSIDGSKVLSADVLAVDETNLGVNATASFADNFAQAIDFGEDGAGSVSYALVLNGNNVGSGLYAIDNLDVSTADGDGIGRGGEIVLNQNGNVITGSLNGTDYFTITIDAASGAVTFDQLASVWHANTANPDDQSALQALANSLVVRATVVDADGDQAAYDLDVSQGVFQVKDDGPSVAVNVGNEAGILLTTQDADTIGTATDAAVTSANFGNVFSNTPTYGADGAGSAVMSYSLGLIAASGADSGLDSNGSNIYLYDISGTIVGSTSATQAGVNAGNTVFDLSVDGAGVVTLRQHAEIDHPIADDPSASGAPFDDQLAVLGNNLVSLTATALTTDGDGDTATASERIDLGGNVRFADDGPSVTMTVSDTNAITLNTQDAETIGALSDSDSASFATAFAVTPNYGADGAGTTVTTYALSVSAQGVDSGLDNNGNNIYLYNIAGSVVGSTSATQADITTGNTIFSLGVNSSSGVVTLTQHQEVDHGLPGASSNYAAQEAILNTGLVFLNATAMTTDGDGDTATASASLDLGGNVKFDDDGPSVTMTVSDNNAITLNTQDAETIGALSDSDSASFATAFAVTPNYGADGAGTTVTTYALSVSAQGVDSGLDNNGNNIYLYNIAGSVVGSTSATQAGITTGNTIFSLGVNSSSGVVTLTQHQEVDHGLPGASSNYAAQEAILNTGLVFLNATAVTTDGDGDTATASASLDLGGNVKFDDDGPSVTMTVSDTNAITLNTQDAETIGALSDSDSASFAAAFAVTPNYGADGAGTTVTTYALSVSAQGVDSGLDNNGNNIYLYNIAGSVVGSTSATQVGITTGNTIFSLGVNSSSGVVTLTQHQEVDHGLPGASSNYAAQEAILNTGLVFLNATAVTTDGDGDTATASASLDLGGNVKFDDDGPSVTMTVSDNNAITLNTQDAETIGALSDSDSASFAAAFAVTPNYGADGAGTTVTTYALSVSAQGVDSGLDNNGNNIYLYNIAGSVVGSTSATQADITTGNTIFSLGVNSSSGVVTLTQHQEVDHGLPGASSNYAAQEAILNTGLVFLNATAVTTDGDGDTATASASLDLGGNVKFDDDGPSVTMTVSDNNAITLNTQDAETIGALSDSDSASFATAFAVTPNYGADGAGTTVTTYALSVSAQGVDSGLDNNGNNIYLYNIAGSVVGSTSATQADITTGNTIFSLGVNSSSGVVTLTQHQEVDHGLPGASSNYAAQEAILNTGLVFLNATAMTTDGDGDTATASASLDLGGNVKFDDDGPSVTMTVSDNNAITLNTQDAETIGALSDSDSASFATAFAVTPNYGADGAGTTVTTYALSVSAQGVDSGLDNNGNNIYLYNIAGSVVGSTSATQAGITTGNTIFSLGVNSSSGVVTLTQHQEVDHGLPGASSNYAAQEAILNTGLVFLNATAVTTDGDGDTATASASLDLGGNVKFDDDGPSVTMTVSDTNAITLNTQDAETIGALSDSDSASFAAAFAVTPNYGADGAGTTVTTYALSVSAQGVDSGLDNNGNNIYLYNIAGSVVGSTSATQVGITTGNTIFSLGVNSSSGVVTLTQHQEVDHGLPGASSNYAAQEAILNTGLVFLNATAVTTDGDGDTATASASLDLGGNVKFDDDGPSVTMTVSDNNAITLNTQDAETIGALSDSDSASFAAAFAVTPNYGADGAGTTVTTYALSVSAQGVDSGLDNNGNNIYLYNIAGSVVGSTSATQADITTGNTIFSLGVNSSSGVVTLTQHQEVDHGLPGASSNYAAQEAILNTGLVFLNATAVTTDGDGDTATASASLDLGGNVKFDDDGPSVTMTVSDNNAITLNTQDAETIGALSDSDSASFAAAFAVTPNYGADGAGTTVTTYALSVSAQGVDSGLDNNGNNIYLYNIAGSVVGSTSATQVGITTGNTIFSLGVNSSSGVVTLTQHQEVDHGLPGASSNYAAQEAILNTGLVFLNATAVTTDGDGDTATASASLDLGGNVKFDDDGPTVGSISLVADEDNLPRGNNDTASGDAAQSNLTGTLPVNFGADGAGSIDFQGMHGMSAVIGNDNITYNWNASTNTLTAYRTGGALGVNDVFKIVVNPTTGQYTFTLLAAINHHAVADNTEGLVDPFVNLNYRVIDGDGDTAIGTLKVTIDDDVPKAITPEEGFVTNQAGIVRTFDLDFDANIDNNVGADQLGTITFSGITNGQVVTGTVDGVPNQTLTSGGSAIHYYVSGNNVVEGWINGGPGDVGSTIVFRTTLQPDMNYNASNDTYKFELFQPISTSTSVSIANFSGVNSTSREFIYLEDASSSGEDILFSAYIRNDNGSFTDATANTSTQGIGVNNQNMNDRENLRLDFVRNVSTNGTTSNMTYEYDDHYTVNNFSFKIVQVTGSLPAGSIEVWVRAYNADDDDPSNNTVSSANNLAHQDALRDDPQVALTQILVNGVPVTPTAVNASGGYLISGLNLNDTITLRSANGYDRVEIENARSGAHGVSNSNLNGETFDIGLFSYNTIKTTPSEININMGLSLTDSDGDKINSSIEINLAPSVFKVGENVDDTSSSNVPHRVGGDTGVIDGSGGADILVGDVGGVEVIGTTARLAFILDESGSMSQNFGGTTRLEVLKQAMTDILTELSNTPNASITVHLVKFASIVNGTGTFEITGGGLQQALDFISGLQIQQGLLAGTNYEAALGQTVQWFSSQSGTVDVQQTLFFTDGVPTFYMDGNSTEYTNLARVYGNGSQTEEVLWENLFGEHAGGQATSDRINNLTETDSRDLDGLQSYSIDTNSDGIFETQSVNSRSSGTTQTTNDLVSSIADTFNEVQALQAYGTLRAVSIADNANVYLQEIDSTGQPYLANSPEVLQDILDELNPFNVLLAAGSDTIQANQEDDLIFGDVLFTDKLAEDEGVDLPKGSGWAVFEELEANHGWSRQDTLDYIKNHADELGRETVLSSGKRSGGHDTISGGQGDDRIYGQEGNDVIDAGSGDDVIVGGTGNDTLTGGSGADQFVLVKGQGGASAGAAPIDTITDFEVSIDKIVINGNNITGVNVSTPVSNTYTITVNYSDAATEHFKVTLSNGALLNDSGKTHLNGVVISGGTATIDGTIVGAVLYLDLNANNQEDAGERLGITNQYGHVEWVVDLSKFDVNGDGQYVIGEARAVQTGGFDIDTGLSYEINLYGPVGSAVISPLTSLLQAQLEAGMDYETANAALVARLGLPEGTQIISFNPITGSGEVLAQNAGVMTAAIQFAEIAAIHYSTDERHVSFAVFEAISKALLELPEGVVADFGDEGFLQSISNYLGLDALVTSDMIDYMATSQKALEASILTLAPGEDALTAISKIQHVTQGIYAQAIEMALIGYLPLDALKNMSAVLKAYADGDITDEQLNSFEDKLSAVIVNWEDNNVTDTSHQATLQTERTVDDSSVKSEVNHEMAQEVNAVINDFMDEHNISLYYYDQQAQLPQEAQEQQPIEDQAEETVMHDDIVQDLLLDDHSLTMLANNPQLNGGNGNDVLHGTTGNDFIRGGQGNDTMTGGGGVDTFFWLSGDDDGGVDTITDFKANPVDQSSDASVLNLSDLLSDADLETNSLDNYLNVSTTEEGDTAIKVDPNGNGNFDAPAQTIILEDVDLTAVFATNNSHDIVNQMIANGNLIVEQ
ncbi:enhanced entry virulence factor RtxA [Legionella pneumophila]|uniref:enhanced entry virulence factor RtxA n=30 Tax=Legionella pneumophila TaxID=446 RepID=UPI000B949065|nr:structural toxin protein RtxA [Legionella pneumophila]